MANAQCFAKGSEVQYNQKMPWKCYICIAMWKEVYSEKVFAAKYKGWKIYILTENRVANFPAAVNTSLNVEWSEANFAKQFSSCYFLLTAHIYVFCMYTRVHKVGGVSKFL